MVKSTMSDVALRAGVSTATVSHVINNTRYVAEETRIKVMNSIEELGYSPNEMARILKTGKKNLIGFVVPDIANEFFAVLIEEVEDVISHNSFKLIVTNTRETEKNEIDSIRALTSGIVDGILIASTLRKFDTLKNLIPQGFPAILIDRTFPDATFNSVTISNYRAVYQGITAMIQKGHKNIGYIAGLQHISTAAERFSAYKDALTDAGLPIQNEYICFGDSMHNSASVHVGNLLAHNCTAIAISNNAMAEDVIYYCHKHGIKIGKDIDILTSNLDDRRYYYLGKMGYVRQPALDLARLAGNQIMSIIENPDMPVNNIVFQASYIEIDA